MVNQYELLRCGKVLGVYTAKEIAGKLHCGISTVRAYACDGRKLNEVYTFRIKYAPTDRVDAKILPLKEWEAIRQRLLSSGYNLGRIVLTRPE